MWFGPRLYAEGMDEILDEAFALTDQIYITEYGADARVHQWSGLDFEFNDAIQADYLKQLTERIQNYSARHRREIKGIFCWSDLRRQMEWENGLECRLATIDPIVDGNRRMIGWNPTPASKYLAKVYKQQERQVIAI